MREAKDDVGPYWEDGETDWACDPERLRTYLLTGDRPLRIQAADNICCRPSGDDRGGAWFARVWAAKQSHTFAYGETPAEAILACAEAVAG
jgi:hypothetical protein